MQVSDLSAPQARRIDARERAAAEPSAPAQQQAVVRPVDLGAAVSQTYKVNAKGRVDPGAVADRARPSQKRNIVDLTA
ncbi:MAG: hypothetical protein ABUS48_05590 [Pseudomonadota bacterium]